MPGLLYHHNCFLTRSDGRHLRGLLDRALPAHGWKGSVDGGVFIPEKVDGAKDGCSLEMYRYEQWSVGVHVWPVVTAWLQAIVL